MPRYKSTESIGSQVYFHNGETTTGHVYVIAGRWDNTVALVRFTETHELITLRCHVSHTRPCAYSVMFKPHDRVNCSGHKAKLVSIIDNEAVIRFDWTGDSHKLPLWMLALEACAGNKWTIGGELREAALEEF